MAGLNEAIFKAYDVRGLYPEQLDSEAALAIGRALARFLEPGPVVVGRDMRESGLALREALIAGLAGEGRDVIDVGRVATPIVYFATNALDAAGGAMITASHNPGAYNGIKLCAREARPIGIESGLREVRENARACYGRPRPTPRGSLREQPMSGRYVEALLEMFPARPRLHVVVDCGNGIAGEAFGPLFERLPLRLERLYFEPDGSFPNHEADPLKEENLADLRAAVLRSRADLGVAFDGDGDRAVFVDERGEAVPADLTTALFARAVLQRGLLGAVPGCPVIYDLRSSRVVDESVRAAGGSPIRGRVGHAFMKARMRETGACFAGELSGHYYFRFASGYVADDAAAAVMLLLEVMAAGDAPLSALWEPLRVYAGSGEINSQVEDVKATLARVRQAFPDGRVDELDGLTLSFDDWWFNLRPSNTEPLLRLNLEAATPEEMVRHRDRVLKLVRA